MKKCFKSFYIILAAPIILTIFTACGGGGGGGGGGGPTLYNQDSGYHNGGKTSWNGSSGSTDTTGSGGVVLSGGTSLEVEYYEYNGQRYATAEELTAVLARLPINGTIEIPLHAKDGTDRIAKYVVNGDTRTLKHPYKITILGSDGTPVFSGTNSSGQPQYFYASEGFPMNILPDGSTETICGTQFSFNSSGWSVSAGTGAVTVPLNGTYTGSFGEGAVLQATPVLTQNYVIDSNGKLGVSSSYSNGETITIPAGTNITEICLPANKQVALDLTNATINTSDTFGSNVLNTQGRTSLGSITLPNNIDKIESNAFENCSNLAGIDIPQSVSTIDVGAFKNCSSLSNVTIQQNPDYDTRIAASAFENCTSLTEITLPGTIINFDSSAFNGCANLKTVTMDSSLANDFSNSNLKNTVEDLTITTDNSGWAYIAQGAFQGNTTLKHVTLPETLGMINDNAFNGCTSLETINLPDAANSCTIGESAFEGCTSLTSLNNPPVSPSEIPTCCTTVNDKAFKGCSALSLTVPDTVGTIGESAFENTRVKEVNFRNDITNIKEAAFKNCHELTTANFPSYSNISTFEESAFEGCENLVMTSWPASNATTFSVGENAFNGCTKCTFSVPELNSIGTGAFKNSGITGAIIGNSITEIPSDAFNGCEDLATLTLPNSITAIGQSAFYNCKQLQSTNINLSNVTSIGFYAFENCENLTGSVTLGDVTNLGNYAFYGCNQITSVNFGSSSTLSSINRWAFQYCSSLSSITIPNTVTEILDYAFSDCTSLTNINIPQNVTTIGGNAFANINNLQVTFNNNPLKSAGNISYGNQSVFASTPLSAKTTWAGTNYEWSNPSYEWVVSP